MNIESNINKFLLDKITIKHLQYKISQTWLVYQRYFTEEWITLFGYLVTIVDIGDVWNIYFSLVTLKTQMLFGWMLNKSVLNTTESENLWHMIILLQSVDA